MEPDDDTGWDRGNRCQRLPHRRQPGESTAGGIVQDRVAERRAERQAEFATGGRRPSGSISAPQKVFSAAELGRNARLDFTPITGMSATVTVTSVNDTFNDGPAGYAISAEVVKPAPPALYDPGFTWPPRLSVAVLDVDNDPPDTSTWMIIEDFNEAAISREVHGEGTSNAVSSLPIPDGRIRSPRRRQRILGVASELTPAAASQAKSFLPTSMRQAQACRAMIGAKLISGFAAGKKGTARDRHGHQYGGAAA